MLHHRCGPVGAPNAERFRNTLIGFPGPIPELRKQAFPFLGVTKLGLSNAKLLIGGMGGPVVEKHEQAAENPCLLRRTISSLRATASSLCCST